MLKFRLGSALSLVSTLAVLPACRMGHVPGDVGTVPPTYSSAECAAAAPTPFVFEGAEGFNQGHSVGEAMYLSNTQDAAALQTSSGRIIVPYFLTNVYLGARVEVPGGMRLREWIPETRIWESHPLPTPLDSMVEFDAAFPVGDRVGIFHDTAYSDAGEVWIETAPRSGAWMALPRGPIPEGLTTDDYRIWFDTQDVSADFQSTVLSGHIWEAGQQWIRLIHLRATNPETPEIVDVTPGDLTSMGIASASRALAAGAYSGGLWVLLDDTVDLREPAGTLVVYQDGAWTKLSSNILPPQFSFVGARLDPTGSALTVLSEGFASSVIFNLNFSTVSLETGANEEGWAVLSATGDRGTARHEAPHFEVKFFPSPYTHQDQWVIARPLAYSASPPYRVWITDMDYGTPASPSLVYPDHTVNRVPGIIRNACGDILGITLGTSSDRAPEIGSSSWYNAGEAWVQMLWPVRG